MLYNINVLFQDKNNSASALGDREVNFPNIENPLSRKIVVEARHLKFSAVSCHILNDTTL